MRGSNRTVSWYVGMAVACAMLVQVARAQEAPTAATSEAGDAGVSLAAFDVVSVKPFDPNQKMIMRGVMDSPDGLHAVAPLALMIRVAYGGFSKLPTDDSVTGLPDWARTQMYTVDGKMSPEQAAAFAKLPKDQQEPQRQLMLQAILADRFGLKVHRLPKQVPDYELVVAKGGPKLKESGAPDPNGPKGPDGKPITGGFVMMKKNGQIQAQQFTVEALANMGQGMLGIDRMVVNKTGLTGKYDFTLNWTPDGMGSASVAGVPVKESATPDDNAPSIFTAMQEQLGLKLVPGTGMIDLVVVDHVEKPGED